MAHLKSLAERIMKRDMDLIRRLLLEIERADSGLLFEGVPALHVELLVDAGLVEAHIARVHDLESTMATVSRLTWSGHDFLDAMRDDTIWKKAQEAVLKPIGGVAFDVLLAWLKVQMREKLGIPGSD